MDIDNGNHLILSGNHATLSYLDVIGARDRLYLAPRANFPFMDIATGSRWTVRANDGPIPWWIFDPRRRPPGTRVREYLAWCVCCAARPGATIGETMSCEGPLYDRLIRPFCSPRSISSRRKALRPRRSRLPRDARRWRSQLSPDDRPQWPFRRAGDARCALPGRVEGPASLSVGGFAG